jgi:anion-transporting  ArsA/GET3 family ATPase
MKLNKIFDDKQIIICCGSGGVGKTTTAAAIALEAASRGKKVIVLTIDPAKRLATAMGIDALGNVPKEIPLPKGSGSLFAMMLDTKRTFDRLIERYADSPAARQSILNNQLYQNMSNMIAGSQEYMAMEKLYELHHEGDYDLMVLDTPPTRHALDFLDAPKKMINITENSLLKWFLKPGAFLGRASRAGFGVLGKGAEKILSVFDRLAGFGFLHELSEMVALIGNLLGGFHDRARSVYELLRKDFVGFLLITGPSSVSIQDSLYFYKRIKEEGLPFLGFVINRVHEPGGMIQEKDLAPLSPALREKVMDHLRNYEQLALRDQRAFTLLKKMGGKKALYASVPLFSSDVHDLEGLKNINEALFG